MTRYYYKFTFLSFLLVFALLISSCEEDPTTLGKGLLPGSDFVSINTIDTLGTFSYTMYDSIIRAGNLSSSYIGNLYDPTFGTSTAGLVTQLRLKYRWIGSKTWYIDSLKLMMQFESVKGGTTGTNTLSLYEINKQLYTDSTYYSGKEIPLGQFSMTNIVLPALRPDTINNIELKLPLDPFRNRMLSDTSKLFHSNTVPDFRSFFKGMYFKINSTSASDPLLVSVNLNNTGTGYQIIDRMYKNFFVLYMHDFDGTKYDYYFIIDANNDNASINTYSHNFNTAQNGAWVKHINKSYRDSLLYLQSLNGVYPRIAIPGLQNLKSTGNFGTFAVNKARLTVPFYYDKALYKLKSLPARLYLRYRTTDGNKYTVPDLSLAGDQYQSYSDGNIDTINYVYNFNIGTFVQAFLKDNTNTILPELEIVHVSGVQNLIFRGNNNNKKIKFDFTYTLY